jgi:hypothetical protein
MEERQGDSNPAFFVGAFRAFFVLFGGWDLGEG